MQLKIKSNVVCSTMYPDEEAVTSMATQHPSGKVTDLRHDILLSFHSKLAVWGRNEKQEALFCVDRRQGGERELINWWVCALISRYRTKTQDRLTAAWHTRNDNDTHGTVTFPGWKHEIPYGKRTDRHIIPVIWWTHQSLELNGGKFVIISCYTMTDCIIQ